MANIAGNPEFIRGRHRKEQDNSKPITSVRVVIALTAEEARKLPPQNKLREFLGQGAETVLSIVKRTGGELVLHYYASDRPFDGASMRRVPLLALVHVRDKLDTLPDPKPRR